MGIAEKVFKVSGQRSKSQSRLIAVMAEACVLMLWHRGSISSVLFSGDFFEFVYYMSPTGLTRRIINGFI